MSATVDKPGFRARMRAWTKPPRELVMTTSGKVLCLLTLGVGFGAVNTGNNLLFLLLGMLLSLILASGILSEAVLQRLEAKRRLPARLVAGVGANGSYRVENPRNWASMSIDVGDRNALAVAGPAAGREVGPPVESWWKVWKKSPTEEPVSNAYALRLEKSTEADLEARFTLNVRGRYKLETMRVSTRFPFGLFEKSRRVEAPAEVTVFPAGEEAPHWVATVFGRFGEVPTNKRGLGDEFYGLRDYRTGEDRRRIHWKSTARRGAAVVRETEALTQREVEICFCDWSARPVSPAAFERGVSRTVGLIGALSHMGWRIGLRTRDLHLEPGTGASHVDAMLSALAVVVPHAAAFELGDSTAARIAIGASASLGDVDHDVALAYDEVDDA